MNRLFSRRKLLAGSVAISVGASASATSGAKKTATGVNSDVQVTTDPNADLRQAESAWPVWNVTEEAGLSAVLNSGKWGRLGGSRVAEFEKTWSEKMKSRYCIATSSGTSALLTALGALNIGPGDEVILPPYTFVATFNAITSSYALPVFVDSDRQSFQIDPNKIAAAINSNTKLLLPVHIAGLPFDIDAVSAISQEKGLPFIEDACQAHLASWRGKPVGNHGLAGCFSFQASKNLNAGEGGAILTNDEDFANRCFNFHTPGGPKPAISDGRGSNFRMTEFQGKLLMNQFARVEAQSQRREANAKYLTELLSKIPGISPAKVYDPCDRCAWHLYMFRYDKTQFGGMSRQTFLSLLGEAGISASSGYSPLNQTEHVQAIVRNPHYQRIYGSNFMANWVEKNRCPVNDMLCSEAVWLTQNSLLADRSDMEKIAASIDKIRKRAG